MKSEFSKILMVWELVVVSILSGAGFYLAYLSITHSFSGSLPWITAMVAPSWAAYGVSKAFFTEKAKAENVLKIPAYFEQEKEKEANKCFNKDL